jgi:Uma2 family endonuclease
MEWTMSIQAIPVLLPPEEVQTAAELERLSTTGARFELVAGRLREMPPVGGEHGVGTKRLDTMLSVFVYEHKLGECTAAETGFLVARNPDTVLAPDWAFICTQRLPTLIPRSFFELAPDIALETRSPSDSARWMEEKARLWLEAGTSVVLNLDPHRRCLTVHRAGRETQLLGPTDVLELEELPGLQVRLHIVLR